MYFCVLCVIALFVMAGSFDDNDFSLSGLTQEGHEVDVTVISDSEETDDNLAGLFECAKVLETGKKSNETSNREESMAVTEPSPEGNVPKGSVQEMVSSGLNVSNSMASSMAGQEKNFYVSFVTFCLVEVP